MLGSSVTANQSKARMVASQKPEPVSSRRRHSLDGEDRRSHQSFANSFRDPDGHVVIADRRVFRVVRKEYEPELNSFLASGSFISLFEDGLLPRTEIADHDTFEERLGDKGYCGRDEHIILEHEHIPFQSYPYEWSPEMLYAAGKLTLDIMDRLLPDGFGLKDASPYNVLYRAHRPVFVDLLSVESRDPLDQIWLPYAQFIRTFVQPLLIDRYFGVGLGQTLRIHRDGLSPTYVFRMCGLMHKIRPPFLTLVSLPALLSKIHPGSHWNIYGRHRAKSPEQARFILDHQLKGLRRKLNAVRPSDDRESAWTDYMDGDHHTEQYLSAKRQLVERVISACEPKNVLDVGCNQGHFSAIAAEAGASVIAIDGDPVLAGRLWRKASSRNLNILPLVVDLARPTPALGWRNAECRAFLDRACGSFDCVMMLAVLHHVLVSERIPLDEIMQLARDLTTNVLIIEYIPPEDPMFRSIARGNDHLYGFLTREQFERVSSKYFVIERAERLEPSLRWLYLMRRGQVA